MKKRIFYLLWLLLFTLSKNSGNAQDSCDNKYLMALYYLRTNTEVNNKIRDFFPKQIPKKTHFVEFNLSNNIAFITYTDFEEFIEKKLMDELRYGKVFLEKYFFDPFKSPYVSKLIHQNNSTLYLYFSKPVDNYLIAELGYFEPDKFVIKNYGIAMKILFKFNVEGFVERVFTSGASYN